MEKSFDFGALLQNHEKKHKYKPTQLVSVAGGVKKRLENSIRNRKSTRLSVFDKIRNLPRTESPVPVKKVLSKIEHRRMQLEKWKEEKEKKKKEASLQKKKPFVAGVPHNPLKFVPPPPPKPMPSISGRVTRSQSSKQNTANNVSKQKCTKTETKQSKYMTQSFAPKNATFNPPIFKNMIKIPTLATHSQNDTKYASIEHSLPAKAPKTAKSKLIAKHEPRNLRSRSQLPEKSNKGKKALSPIKSFSSNSSSSLESNSGEKSPVNKNKTPRKSIQSNKMFTPNNKIPKSESSSEEKLRSPKSIDLPMTPEQIVEEAKKISPCVTLSRGKDNARKEMKKKIVEGLLDEDQCEIDSVDHFRKQLDSEIKRMTEMCETWDKILEQIALPEAVQEAVLGAVGQARLLMSQKLQQFASLLARCERPDPLQALVTPTDLHGFWDMVFMQVENVDMRFKKLEEMRARGWADEPVEPCVKHKVASKPAARSRPAATSRLKDIIAAARKAKKDHQVDVAVPESAAQESKTFDAGFFSVQSPVKSPKQASTPVNKPSLLKAVLSNEANKSASKNSASFAMLRASLIGKNVEQNESYVDLVPLTPINLDATPARSILKSTKKSGKKSIKVVLFDQSESETVDKQYSSENEADITGVAKIETDQNADSGLSSMDVEKEVEGKENKSSRRKSKLIRQDATEDRSPVKTRSMRKSIQTPSAENVEGKKRSSRKKALQEVEINVEEIKTETPKRSSRRKSSMRDVAA
ncbi:disks large-associated protein 5 isoform X2 [Vanessa cardui]|uniref:disks large-associated protein 5 isoform X2 n=1 Tax=Vanessa cardui TaxID=171605 RepID=UPI001F12DD02|nr:disks large-associated protein 5 isoform X2 [Vanessa cardui]